MATKSKDKTTTKAWMMYDWANSAFGTIIITFVFSVYITKSVFDDPDMGSGVWSLTIALAGFLVAITAPILGALADRHGAHMLWLRRVTWGCALLTGLLIFLPPGAHGLVLILGLICVALAHSLSELSYVFYNALLPRVADEQSIGKLSGNAWAVGYMGGLTALVLVLILCIGLGEMKPLLSFPEEGKWHIRSAVLFVAVWYVVFSWPLLSPRKNLFQTEKVTQPTPLKQTFKMIVGHRDLLRLLIASAFYRDGLATLFAVGGTFAAAAFELNYTELLIFAIGLNVSAALGAFTLGRLDDIWGPRRVIFLSLIALIALGGVILQLESKHTFIAVSLLLGIFIGPVQSASRSFVARLAPADQQASIFGFYALTGKAIAFAGPLLYGLVTVMSGNARLGLCVIIAFWAVGLMILWGIREQRHSHAD